MMQRTAYFEVTDKRGQTVIVRLRDPQQIREAIRRGTTKWSLKNVRRFRRDGHLKT